MHGISYIPKFFLQSYIKIFYYEFDYEAGLIQTT